MSAIAPRWAGQDADELRTAIAGVQAALDARAHDVIWAKSAGYDPAPYEAEVERHADKITDLRQRLAEVLAHQSEPSTCAA